MDAVGPRSPIDAVPLLSAEEAADGDRRAVDAGTTWAGLMERAAGHLARGVVDLAGFGYGLEVTFVCGRGNNGGDGWAAARRIREAGASPRVVAVDGLDAEMSAEAADNRRRYLAAGGRAHGPEGLDDALERCDVAVDCLLGTGATGAPRGAAGEATGVLAGPQRPLLVVACDVPTGVDSDDGAVPGVAVDADLTVTFGGLKRGLLLHPGAAHAGRVVVGELGRHYRASGPTWTALTAAGAVPDPPTTDEDKRSRGVVLIVAGSRGMAGAAILCARGALAAGAGLLTVAVPGSVQDVVAGAVPPALTIGLPEDDDGTVAAAASDVVTEHAGRSDAVLAGPGMGPGPGTRAVVDGLLATSAHVVLDADAINVFRGEGDALGDHNGGLLLTPHQRELARITAGADDGADAWRRRVEVVPALAAELDATVLCKGPGTLVSAPDGRAWVNPTGGPELATGGTGDVLGGALAALVARATDPSLAAARGCFAHGVAGTLAGSERGGRPDSAAVADALPGAITLIRGLAQRRPSWPFDAPGFRPGAAPDAEGAS